MDSTTKVINVKYLVIVQEMVRSRRRELMRKLSGALAISDIILENS